MKISIVYESKSHRTEKVAHMIEEGIKRAGDIEVKLMNIEKGPVDKEFINESSAVFFGTPTYYSSISWQMKKWFDESFKLNIEGKIGAAFATADYLGGGSDIALLTLIGHMVVKGMLAYSGGSALGHPYTHLGVTALKQVDEKQEEKIKIFGKRVAEKALMLYESEHMAK